MVKPAYIWHVACGDGMGMPVTKDNISDSDILKYRAHIDRALASPMGDPIPGHPAYATAAQSVSGVLICTVGRSNDMLGVCSFGVVTKSRHAAKAWEALHNGYLDFSESLGPVPRVPFCAVRPEIGLTLDPSVVEWLDHYQVAVAWAWLEHR